ncbi:MAG: hypothetical protein ACFFCE_15655 [Promethearchaeota archaeon]
MISNFLKYNLLNELDIREIEKKDLDQVIQLIKKVYQSNYDKKYYDKRYLEKYISTVKKKAITFWKGAFFQERLIAQMVFIIKNGVGKLKFTMVDPEFKSKGVISYLGFNMNKVLQLPFVKRSNLHMIYAYVENDNIPMIKVLEEYDFKLFGRTPNYNKKSFYKIYGRVINIKRWKYITPYFSVSRFIQNINIKYNLQRLLCVFIPSFSTPFTKLDLDIEIVDQKKILFLVEGIKYGKIYQDNHSWHDFKFINNPSRDIKFSILVKLIEEFKKNEKIYSISLFIDVNDLNSQEYLLKKGCKFFAYLPYYHEDDIILIGKTKTRDDNNE